MSNPLFERISVMAVWFWLGQLLTAIGIANHWILVFQHPHGQMMARNAIAVTLTILFVASNVLLFRGRRVGYLGAVISWLLLALILLPTL
jgi:hypothetical protein